MGSWRLRLPVLTVVSLLAGCAPMKIELVPESDEPPLFRRIDARVGTVYASAARRSEAWAGPMMRVNFGEQSITRFRQVFGAMFTHTYALPDWPPWREGVKGIDGVMELERAKLEIELGNDIDRPDSVWVEYRACLYEPAGMEIDCWMMSAHQVYQRRPFECVGLSECVKPMIEVAARQAIARFMVEVEGNTAVKAWAARASRSRGSE